MSEVVTMGILTELQSRRTSEDERLSKIPNEELLTNMSSPPNIKASPGGQQPPFMSRWNNSHHCLDPPYLLLNSGGVPPPSSSSPSPPPISLSSLPPPANPLLLHPEESVMPLCAGCRLRIVDRFYLFAVQRKWHSSCLKCAECGVELETQQSCFEKNGHLFCKDDYLRIYGNKRCSRCMLEIQSSDLVMKAKQCLFHIDCFRCAVCDVMLKKGDVFGMSDDVLYCKMHFELLPSQQQMGDSPLFFPHHPHAFPSPFGGQQQHDPWYPPPPGSDFPMGGPGGVADDYPYDNNNEPMLKKRRGRKKRKVESFMNGFLEGGGPFPGSGGMSGMDPQQQQGKTKRARTSFKHHQLRIMKSHFQINQNPDSRELKMLSQKTGLDKKVLQVWFQNARAKWRRVNAQGGGGGGGPSGPISGMDSSQGSLSSMRGAGGGGGGGGSDNLSAEENCDSDSMTA